MLPGERNNYKAGFETIVDTLNARKNYVLGQYYITDGPDRFVWIRGFDDMPSRKEALTGFFESMYWKEIMGSITKDIVNYTNVYLLKPLQIEKAKIDSGFAFDGKWFATQNNFTVVDFYLANGMRDDFIGFLQSTFDSVLSKSGARDRTYWISEMTENNSPLPAFQDQNLVVAVTHFASEKELNAASAKLKSSLKDKDLYFQFHRLVTTHSRWVLYPGRK